MTISTHILDLTTGKPAASVRVTLAMLDAKGHWTERAVAATDFDGRCRSLLENASAGTYRLYFETGPYFAAQNIQSLYPFIEVTFVISDTGRSVHVPLLLSPFGYSTYRGS
jgi:5-hydroxyisourate hydrolase